MLACLKCFSSIGAIIMLLVGLAFTGITVYAFLNQDVFLSDENIKHNILNGMIIVSSTVITIAITGIVGVIKKKCCPIVIYQFFLVVFLAVFLGLGIGSKIIPDKVFDGDCKNSTNDLITSAHKLYQESDKYFCKSSCPCAIQKSTFSKYSLDDQNILSSQYIIDAINGANATQNCKEFENWTDSTTINFPGTVGAIQEFLKCSDWCPNSSTNNLFYRFWNANQGKPTQTCYMALHDAFFNYSGVVGTTCFVIAAIFGLVCICNICLCCHPDRKKLEFRDRFIYIANDPRTQNYKRI